MRAERVRRVAHEKAIQFPAVTVEYPFGPEWEVYKVLGKVFMLRAEVRGKTIVNLKADPEDVRALCDGFDEITPGYHMNKKHWISVYGGEGIDARLVEELVIDSYRLVVEKLPRAKRPVDPATFGAESDSPGRASHR